MGNGIDASTADDREVRSFARKWLTHGEFGRRHLSRFVDDLRRPLMRNVGRYEQVARIVADMIAPMRCWCGETITTDEARHGDVHPCCEREAGR